MPDGKSFNEHLIKIGSHDARMRWGRHRLGIPEPTNDALVGFEPNKESPPPTVELTLPMYFAGKIFVKSRGATDHVAHPQLMNYYNQQIAGSHWADDHIYNNPPRSIHLKPAKFSEPRYKIFGTQGNSRQYSAYNIEWHTEGDYDVERGLEASSSRSFGSTEMRALDTSKTIELLAKGYDLWSQLAGTTNLNWIDNVPLNTGNRSIVASSIKAPATEKIAIPNGQNTLWNSRKWLENDSLVASLANTYMAIDKGKHVIMPKFVDMSMKEAVLIAQALTQMFAAKKNMLIGFVTDRGILGYSESKPQHLTFTDEKRHSYLQSDDVFIDPLNSGITNGNATLVDKMREIFSRPLHIALEAWKNASIT